MSRSKRLQTAGVSSYQAAFRALRPLLVRGSERVWFRNGLRAGLATPFLSDIDLSFDLGNATREEALRARRRFLRVKRVFPFLGEAHFFTEVDRRFAASAMNPLEKKRDPDLETMFPDWRDRPGDAFQKMAFALRLFWSDRRNLRKRPALREGKWRNHAATMGLDLGTDGFSTDLLLRKFEDVFPRGLRAPWSRLLETALEIGDEDELLARIREVGALREALLVVSPRLWLAIVLGEGHHGFSEGLRRVSLLPEPDRRVIAEQMRWELASLGLQLAWLSDRDSALAHAKKVFAIFRFADPAAAEATLFEFLKTGYATSEELFQGLASGEISPTFCVLPSWDLNLAGGFLKTCPKDLGTREGSDVRVSSLTAALSSDFHQRLAADHRAGRKSDHCRSCLDGEVSGSSLRLEVLKKVFDPPKDHQVAPLRLANTCGLRCVKCSADGSSTWAEFLGQKPDESTWYLEPKFLEDFGARIKNLKSIHFSGGDGLSFKGHREFLEACLSYEGGQDLELSYNINGQVDPAPYFDLLRRFRSIRFTLVLDGVGLQDEYLRFPSSWAKTTATLAFLKSLSSPFRAKVAISINAFNIFYLPETAKALADFDLELQVPDFTDFRAASAIPADLQRTVRSKIKTAARTGDLPLHILEPALKALDGKSRFTAETRLRIKTLDAIQRMSFQNVFPEIAGAFLATAEIRSFESLP